ncbi:hypothetical protein [Sphingomonas sp.]|jgi:hypothetical protein
MSAIAACGVRDVTDIGFFLVDWAWPFAAGGFPAFRTAVVAHGSQAGDVSANHQQGEHADRQERQGDVVDQREQAEFPISVR